MQANVCQQVQDGCPFGTYDASKSSTYSNPNLPEFQIQYVDGTEIQGVYVSDVLNIGKTQVTNMTMAAALAANSRGIGIMGVGFQSGEAGAGTGGFTYPNIISVLQSEGLINAQAYSLWLDDLAANTGSILFGGVDTNKYHGDLVALPIQLDSQTQTISSFTVAWTGLEVTGGGQTSNFSPSSPQPAILDSGTTDTLLPDDIANNIFNGVGVLTDPEFGNVVPCDRANDDLTFSFTFGGSGGPVVNVSLSEFVTPLLTTDGSQPTFQDGTLACTFAIEAAGDNPILFGDSFMRSAYVVYDLENQQIGLAQTNFDSTQQNVKVFQSSSGIPGVVSTATAASVVQTFSGYLPQTETALGATATGALGSGATSRSATFHLTATPSATSSSGSSGSGSSGSGSSGSSSSTNAANPNLHPSAVGGTSIVVAGLVLASFLFGGGLMVL